MKLFLACLGTETNTFSPFVTGYRTFEETYVARGGNHGATPNMFALPLVRWRTLAEAQGLGSGREPLRLRHAGGADLAPRLRGLPG